MEGLAPERHVILVEIGLRAQNMLTILDSIVNMTGDIHMSSKNL
jgi:hypothetical protein